MTDLSPNNDQETSVEEMSNPILPEALSGPAAPTERDRRKQQQRVDAREWFPRESVAVLHRQVHLGSPTLVKAWNALFVRTQIAMHMLQEVLPSTGEMEQARGVEKLLDERLTTLESELQAERTRLMALAASDGISPEEIPAKSYPGSQDINVPIFTPGARRYLNLLNSVDELFWLTDYLWLSGMIRLDHKWQIVNRWKRLLWDFVKFTTQTWIRARGSLRRKQDDANQRRRGGGAQAQAPEAAGADAEAPAAEAA